MSLKLTELVLFQTDPQVDLVGCRCRTNLGPSRRHDVRVLDNEWTTSTELLALSGAGKQACRQENTNRLHTRQWLTQSENKRLENAGRTERENGQDAVLASATYTNPAVHSRCMFNHIHSSPRPKANYLP